jgi:hypothetical protein
VIPRGYVARENNPARNGDHGFDPESAGGGRNRDGRRSLTSVIATERLCQGCGLPLPSLARPNRHHHDERCRALAYRRRRAERPSSAIGDTLPGLTAEQQAVLDSATSEVRLVALVAQQARTTWRAAAWLLERQFPERWGPQRFDRDEPPLVSGPGDPFAEVDELAERRRKPPGY